ncbi:Os01g0668700 [Oryza sativa Japonica Group]|uniref:Os01g0668700 protein n=1 Tax=Oryza sativa subsp. japonica TaxID=39947 RepID=A0A0P0V6I2_ORYSJ|nr:hypothetical protein EE612_004889 [Oryza sativa]BAS73607.1 Os01g0668700 [Oryza sativa Japonica Group]
MTRLPVSRRTAVVPLPELVLLSQFAVPLTSARTRLPSWFSVTLEPWPFTGDLGFADHTTVLFLLLVNQMEKEKAFPPTS